MTKISFGAILLGFSLYMIQTQPQFEAYLSFQPRKQQNKEENWPQHTGFPCSLKEDQLQKQLVGSKQDGLFLKDLLPCSLGAQSS